MTGLRDIKKQRTHEAISTAAITLFLQRGFDEVSVAEIAAAAEVSKPTLFKYFATKEDLVLHRIADHQGEAARVVRRRRPGEEPLVALERHFLAGLHRRDPVTGLNDNAEVLGYHRMVFGTPSLAARVSHYMAGDEEALAEALAESTDDLTARLVAGQVLAVQRVLAHRNWRRLAEGETAEQVHPAAVRAARHAFTLLRDGAGAAHGPEAGPGAAEARPLMDAEGSS
ncbi:TetR family transcriptional regulator [Streptosporangium sp. NBC_01756]|uniref:TetR family transcriptional regulator n=1 Tax=Streptosporangium sp. NBC_01756 TaxID=2975950 RepID=UPI002DD91B74|nr:TetR family transcriptional regulator [Streptosporangium sp. NBC_01756]WSC86139.1 TetR family transcriptional regulator [Streptosporangium sp. NBC_01756]